MIKPEPTLKEWFKMPLSTVRDALRLIFFGQSLQDTMERYKDSYNKHPARIELVKFEKEIIGIRESIAKGLINPVHLNTNLRVWATYPRQTFYIQLRLLYLNKGFYADASRVLEMASKGARVTVVKNENGSTTSETVNSDYGKPVFVEF